MAIVEKFMRAQQEFNDGIAAAIERAAKQLSSAERSKYEAATILPERVPAKKRAGK